MINKGKWGITSGDQDDGQIAHPIRVHLKMLLYVRKILAPIKIKSALPPKKTKIPPPPQNEEFCGHGGFPAERRLFFQVSIKFGSAISGPRIADTNFTDTGMFPNMTLFRGGSGFGVFPPLSFPALQQWAANIRHLM